MTRGFLAALLALALFGCAKEAAPDPRGEWVGSWATPQQIPEPHNLLTPEAPRDITLRQFVHLSVGGAELRVRLSNAFGTAPLRIASAHIARPAPLGSGGIEADTDTALTFSGRPDVIIPAGADYWSDPVTFEAPALSNLAITLYLPELPAQQTGHPGSRTTSFVAPGDQVSAATLANAQPVTHWYNISGVDVVASSPSAAIAILGDSITDGRGSTTDGNNRWPDMLAARLQASAETRHLAVLNLGVGGNRLLNDGNGPNVLARLDRDVAAQTGVRYLIVFEGVNDLGTLTSDGEVSPEAHAALVARVISAYEQIITRAHARGVRVYGATLTPFGGMTTYRADAAAEADREAVNHWIRTSGRFDAVIDFDAATRDPAQPTRLLAAYDTGDHLHLSPEGFNAMANAIPLDLFAD
jgi:lysophospholipase L1-like esterase